MDNILEDTAY